MHDILICALSLATGLAIAEYYNRGRIDAIRLRFRAPVNPQSNNACSAGRR